jgi:hypothetical protein
MATLVDGRLQPDSVDAVLEAMVNDFEAQAGENLPPGVASVLRSVYRPIAERLVEAQQTAALVLDSAQIDHAEDEALDLLTALIGVSRRKAVKAEGTVTLSRASAASQDYPIPAGAEVQTSGNDPVVFVTAESATLSTGETSVDVAVKARTGGVRGNVGPGAISVLRSTISGVEEVTNASETTGGRDRENDTELRERAKDNLSSGSRASASALISALMDDDDVTSVTIFINDLNVANGDGQPGHSFELVVEAPDEAAVLNRLAQAIADTKAAGDTSVGGYYGTAKTGTATLVNGQTETINFSLPTGVQIYVDIDMTVTEEYAGDDAVRDSIVRYIGGVLSTGNTDDGRLSVGSDVIYGSVEYAIRDVTGVYDINTLEVGTSASPTGTTNISITNGEKATANATDGSITFTTSVVTP